jgi:fumarate reductase (CoM/CoB) subunit A
LTRALEKWQPNQFHYLKDMGFDLRETLVEVAPHAHYTLGGVAIDEEARTTVPGLFAAGEVAGNLHGANRVSGNALAETQVFGALAGTSAAGWAKGKNFGESPDERDEGQQTKALLGSMGQNKERGFRPFQVREKLRRIMWDLCGVEREDEGLARGGRELERVEKEMIPRMAFAAPAGDGSFGPYPREVQDALEVRMMITVGKLVLASALFRKETRGHHLRTDYPSSSGEPVHTMIARGKDPWTRVVKRTEPQG